MTRSALQYIITSGPEDPDRARFALNAGLVAAASGLDVSIYLALRAVHWACAVHEANPVHEEVRALVERVRAHGATIECCSECMERHCATPPTPHSGGSKLDEGVRAAGLASLVRRASSGAQTITF